MTTDFKDSVQAFVAELRTARNGRYGISSVLKQSMNNVEVTLSRLIGNDPNYTVRSSVGAGNWANVAWIAVLDKQVTQSTQNGYYISMLFNYDLTRLYIGLGLGVTRYQNELGQKVMDQHVKELRLALGAALDDLTDLIWDGSLDFGVTGKLPDGYKRATVFTKLFDVNSLPDDGELGTYLNRITHAHDEALPLLTQLQSTATDTSMPAVLKDGSNQAMELNAVNRPGF